MPKVRAYGADSTLKACRETTYGVAPVSGYRSLDFKSADLSAEHRLDDPLLGRGRNAQDPYRGLITDEGKVEIPLDLRGSGFWLTGLFGDPTVTQTKATGHIAFFGQPAANSTITFNGVSWTFVTGTPSGNQTQIGANVDATLTALATGLNASADPQVAKCTYTANTTDDRLEIQFDAAGVTGSSFNLAASSNSNGTCSGATLTGGGYRYEWLSGETDIPSHTFEIGPPAAGDAGVLRHLRHGDGEPRLRDGPRGAGERHCAGGGSGRGEGGGNHRRDAGHLRSEAFQPGTGLHHPGRRAARRCDRRQPHLLQQPGAGAGDPVTTARSRRPIRRSPRAPAR
ncbi:MAG: hypothetical protein IPK78_18915 [Rhodospirillales bacterium]|nr:hypothetical protein [Rhodospirillales bacterium]